MLHVHVLLFSTNLSTKCSGQWIEKRAHLWGIMGSSSMLDRVLSALSSSNREVFGQIYSDYLPQHLKAQGNIAHMALR